MQPEHRNFWKDSNIPLRDEKKGWLVWEEIPDDHRRTITSALAQQLLAHGGKISRLFAESYIFPAEPERTPLRNAQEFATLLNACGRWSRPRVGGSICRGDRGVAYRQAEHMLTNHRAIIRELLQFILDTGVSELSHLQYIHVGNRYPDTIVGIGAGMALSRLNMDKPILLMVEQPEDPGVTKVKAEKKAGRETGEGCIGAFIDKAQGVAALVVMRCETAPVAK